MTTDNATTMFTEIEAYPPLMRAKARAAYVGREVELTATFFTGEPEGGKRAFVAFRHEPSDKMLFAHVRLADYPWLESAERGAPVRVRGRVAGIGALAVDLVAVSLARLDAHEARH